MLFRSFVSRQAAGKGRAVLEGVGLLSEVIDMCYVDHPHSEEEAVQAGLIKWRNGGGDQPTWRVLMDAIVYAQIGSQHLRTLEEELLKGAVLLYQMCNVCWKRRGGGYKAICIVYANCVVSWYWLLLFVLMFR